jgi:hypothetical protein
VINIDTTVKCKKNCYDTKSTLLFECGKEYKIQMVGSNSSAIKDETGAIRQLFNNNKPTTLMNEYFEKMGEDKK